MYYFRFYQAYMGQTQLVAPRFSIGAMVWVPTNIYNKNTLMTNEG